MIDNDFIMCYYKNHVKYHVTAIIVKCKDGI